jgi:AraC-like DNA-binding protein/mannose-6-phosphate isomerase-like protein (cupin superfamily)
MERNSLFHSELRVGEYQPKVAAFYYKQWNDFQMSYHSHDRVEIMYVITGKCVVDTVNELFVLKKGDFILLDANVSHKLLVEKDSPCRMLNIEFLFADKAGVFPSIKDLALENQALNALLSNACPYLLLQDPNETYHTLKSLVFELDKGGLDNELMVQLLLSQLLIRIAGLAAATLDEAAQQINLYVNNAIAYIHHHYDYQIQVKDIAASVNLHPGYLHRIFKANTGQTVNEYLTSLRIEKAKMLLSQTDIPVIELFDYIGMNSREYFSAIFKKHTGLTPMAFRKSIEAVKWNEGK